MVIIPIRESKYARIDICMKNLSRLCRFELNQVCRMCHNAYTNNVYKQPSSKERSKATVRLNGCTEPLLGKKGDKHEENLTFYYLIILIVINIHGVF
jgi:hypothetical protein